MKKLSLKTKKRIRGLLAVVVAIAIAVPIFLNSGFFANALFNPDDAITYAKFRSKRDVEDAVLFVGTYIVHKDAMTDPLYEKAQESASESGQDTIYYKSELSDGQWFAIEDIEIGIYGITDQGVPVSEDVIDKLYVTYYAGADGILIDAKTLDPINPFDIPDPYDLSKLPELEPLWLQYTYSEKKDPITQDQFLENRNSEDTGNLRTDVYNYQVLSTFFSLNLRDEETDKCDEDLNNLNALYINLKAQGRDDEADLVYDLMEKTDAKRRMLVMERLIELDPNLLNTLNTLLNGSNYTPTGNFKDSSDDENKDSNPDYINEVEDSTKHDFSASALAVNNPWILTWFRNLGIAGNSDGWWTVLEDSEQNARKRAEEANSENDDYVYDETPKESPFSADSGLLDAVGTCMDNCSQSFTKYQAMSLSDTNDILGHTEYMYSQEVIEKSSSMSLGGPVTNLKHVINIKNNTIDDKEGELELLNSSLISQADSRYTVNSMAAPNPEYYEATSNNAKKNVLENQYASLEVDRNALQFFIDCVRQRDTAENALAFVYERIKIAENLNYSIPKSDFGKYAKRSVEAHIAWLKEEAQKIIDSDGSLKSEADTLKDKKEALQKKRDACLDDNDLAGAKAYDALIEAVDRDIADATGDASGSGSDADNLADGLIDKAMNKLADNADADLSGIADALASMGAEDKLNALKEKAASTGASDSTLRGIQDALDSMNDASGGITANEDALIAALEAFFGKDLDEMNDRELAIACASMSKVAKSDVDAAQTLTPKLANRMFTTKNKYLYSQYTGDKANEYVDLNTISNCTEYRYFYDEQKTTATVVNDSEIKIFKPNSDQMYKGSTDATPESMKTNAVLQNNMMIGEEDAQTYFKCIAEYAYGTGYAVCLTGPMQSAVEECVESIAAFMEENR